MPPKSPKSAVCRRPNSNHYPRSYILGTTTDEKASSNKILLPIGKTPRRGREQQSVNRLGSREVIKKPPIPRPNTQIG